MTIKQFNVKWVHIPLDKIKPEFKFKQGSGFGILTEENDWLGEELTCWVSPIDGRDSFEIHRWCEQHLEPHTWRIGVGEIFMYNEENVSWFMLRWA